MIGPDNNSALLAALLCTVAVGPWMESKPRMVKWSMYTYWPSVMVLQLGDSSGGCYGVMAVSRGRS